MMACNVLFYLEIWTYYIYNKPKPQNPKTPKPHVSLIEISDINAGRVLLKIV